MTDRDGRSPRLGYELGAHDDDEARDFEATASELGLRADPVTPPASLKADLFAKLASTPQLAPIDATDEATNGEAAPDARPAEATARARWFTRPIAIVAAAAAAVVIFIGGALLGSTIAGNNSFEVQQASALAAINAAPDAQRTTADVAGGGTATLVWSGSLGRSALIAKDLPSLPSDKTYELWYIRDGKATAAGTMTPTSGDSATWRVLDGTISDGDTVGVTVEPRGGSEQPTTQPIVAIDS
ncbi:anti-sigma factor domain-containing protein [Leifsonia sp. NPDC058230]|uniref:anti-sigma factor n=1 Tax=Leifsonia sp. NPDC058230 TaxID=3346391 RepID=UPI0036D7C694